MVVDGGPPGTRSGTRPVRVALVLGSATGGVGRHVHSLVRGLCGRGHEVVVFGPSATETRFGFADGGGPGSCRWRSRPGLRPARRARRPGAAPRPARGPGRRGPRARPARRSGGRAGPPGRPAARRHLAQRGARRRPARAGPARPAERCVARSADVTLGASDDLVARARALGAPRRAARPGRGAPAAGAGPTAAAVRRELGVDGTARWCSPSAGCTRRRGTTSWSRPPRGGGAAARPRGRDRGQRARRICDLAGQISPPARRSPCSATATTWPTCSARRDLAVVTSVWEARQLFAQEALTAGVPLVATAVGRNARAGGRRRAAGRAGRRRRARRGRAGAAGRPAAARDLRRARAGRGRRPGRRRSTRWPRWRHLRRAGTGGRRPVGRGGPVIALRPALGAGAAASDRAWRHVAGLVGHFFSSWPWPSRASCHWCHPAVAAPAARRLRDHRRRAGPALGRRHRRRRRRRCGSWRSAARSARWRCARRAPTCPADGWLTLGAGNSPQADG